MPPNVPAIISNPVLADRYSLAEVLAMPLDKVADLNEIILARSVMEREAAKTAEVDRRHLGGGAR